MSQVHVIIGEDDYLVSEAAKRIIGDGVGLETVDSANSTNEELQLRDLREAEASLLTPPFLDPKKTTWWRNVGFLPQSGKGGSSEAVKAALEKFAEKLAAADLPENQHFILSGPRLLQTSIFAKTLKASVEMVVFSAGKPWEQAKAAAVRVIDLAKEMGLSFERGAAEVFVARVGPDSRSLASELAKMRDYLQHDSRRRHRRGHFAGCRRRAGDMGDNRRSRRAELREGPRFRQPLRARERLCGASHDGSGEVLPPACGT